MQTDADTTSHFDSVDHQSTIDLLKIETNGLVGCLEKIPLAVKLIFMSVVCLIGIALFASWLIGSYIANLSAANTVYTYTTAHESISSDYAAAIQDEALLAITYFVTKREPAKWKEAMAKTNAERVRFEQLEAEYKSQFENRTIGLLKEIDKEEGELNEQREAVTKSSGTDIEEIFDVYTELQEKLIELALHFLSFKTAEPELLSFVFFLRMENSIVQEKLLGDLIFSGAMNTTSVREKYAEEIIERLFIRANWRLVAPTSQVKHVTKIDSDIATHIEQFQTSFGKSFSEWETAMAKVLDSLVAVRVALKQDAIATVVATRNSIIIQIVVAAIVAFLYFVFTVVLLLIGAQSITGPWKRMNLFQAQMLHKFVPKRLLQVLEYKSIFDVKLGDEKVKPFVLVSVFVAKNLTMKAMNAFSENSQSIIDSANGFVERYWDHGVVLCFESIKSAMTAVKELQMMNPSLQMGVTFNTVPVCTIGTDNHIIPQIVSDDVLQCIELSILCSSFQVKILASKQAADMASSTISKRYMGLVGTKYTSSNNKHGNSLEIVELFSTFEQKEPFSQAMQQFVSLQYESAAACFVSLQDPVSMYFAAACDTAKTRAAELAQQVSLQLALPDTGLIQEFEKYAAKEQSQENILLWKRIEQFRSSPSLQAARAIVEQFLSENSPNHVNVTNAWYTELGEMVYQKNTYQTNMFDKIQGEIMLLMLDTWKRFTKAVDFEKLIMKSEIFAKLVPASLFTSIMEYKFYK